MATLTPAHRQEWLNSGVSEEIIELNVVSLDDSREIDRRLNRNNDARWKHWQGGNGWWVSGVDPVSGESTLMGGQFKPDTPLPNPQKPEKPRKYVSPSGDEVQPLFLQMPDTDYWAKVIDDPMQSVIVTEGAKKAGAALTAGVAAISLPGVGCGQKGDRLKPAIQKICGLGRRVYLAFDSDMWQNENVWRELDRLARLLASAGAIVYVLQWKKHKGLDDYLTAQKKPSEALAKLIAEAPTFAEVRKAKEEKEGSKVEKVEKTVLPQQSVFADWVASQWKNRYAYDCTLGEWLKYEAKLKGVWSVVKEEMVKQDLLTLCRSKLPEGFSMNYLKNVCAMTQIDNRILTDSLESDPNVLVFKNIAFDVRSGESRPHSPLNRAKWALNRDYDPNKADWEPIARFLRGALGNERDQDRVVAFHAALLRNLFHKLEGKNTLMQKGKSGTGKSTSTRLAVSLVGKENLLTIESIHSLQTESFTLEGLEARPQLIVFPDQSQLQSRMKIDRLLALSGNDWVAVNRKGRKISRCIYEGGLIINSTETVFSQYHLERGMERRCIFISSWRENPALKGIETQFTPDVIAAYTNFLLSIPEIEILEILTTAPGAPAITEQSEDNPIVRWFASHIEVTDERYETIQMGMDKTRADQLFGSYYTYCKNIGTPDSMIKSHAGFSAELKRIISEGIKTFKWQNVEFKAPNNKRTLYGVKFKFEPDDQTLEDLKEQMLGSTLISDNHAVKIESSKSLIQQGLDKVLTSTIKVNQVEEISSKAIDSQGESAKEQESQSPNPDPTQPTEAQPQIIEEEKPIASVSAREGVDLKSLTSQAQQTVSSSTVEPSILSTKPYHGSFEGVEEEEIELEDRFEEYGIYL